MTPSHVVDTSFFGLPSLVALVSLVVDPRVSAQGVAHKNGVEVAE